MAIEIRIQGSVIEFPESSAEPNWAPAIIEFAQAVEAALNQVTGAFDVPPQIQIIDDYNTSTNVEIPNLDFPVTDVRAVEIIYSCYRTTSAETVTEAGSIQMVYNPDASVNQKWQFSRESVGDAKITFNVTDAGQVRFSTEALTGTGHVGRLTYQAKALLQE
jgi:hypothetical protein